MSLSKDNLEKVLGCGGFVTDEILIFKAVMKWVETKFEEEMTASGSFLYILLNGIFFGSHRL
jgi:hypothetical protein